MFCQTALLTPEDQIRYRIDRYVKMRLNEEDQIMNQEEKERNIEKGIDDISLLKDLIKRSREGDTQAMETLYEQYKRPFFNLVYRHTYNFEVAEDLLQDIFLKIFTNLQSLQNVETFGGWAYRIALNTCFSYLRGSKSQLQKTIPLNAVEGTIKEETYGPNERMMKRPLDDAIQALPNKQKSIFLLHDVQGFKHEEIAQMLRISVGTSKSQLFKARIRIRDFLKNKQML